MNFRTTVTPETRGETGTARSATVARQGRELKTARKELATRQQTNIDVRKQQITHGV